MQATKQATKQADGGRVFEGWPFAAEAATPRPLPQQQLRKEKGQGNSKSSKTWHDDDEEAASDVQDDDNAHNDRCPLVHRQGLIWELMPMLQTLRAMLMLPVSFSENGEMHFSWRSLPMVLTFMVWLGVASTCYFAIGYFLDPIRLDRHYHVWDMVPKYCNVFIMGYIFFLPFSSWSISPTSISMIEEWQRLERMVTKLRGCMPVPGLRRRVWCYSFLSVLFPAGMVVLSQAVSFGDAVWLVPITLHMFSFSVLAASFWNLSCRGLAYVAELQAAHLAEDFRRLGVPALRSHRLAWLSMARVLNLLSACWGRTHAVVLLISFACIVCASFLIICMFVFRDFDGRIWLLSILLLYNAGQLISICNSAQIATDAMREPTKKQLLLLSLTHRDKVTLTEVWRFLTDISQSTPKVSVSGMAVLSRATIISFFTLANTYVVVLSQFAISVETTETNFTDTALFHSIDDP